MDFVEELQLLESIRARLEAHQPGGNLSEALGEVSRVRELVGAKRSAPSADKRAARAYGEVLDLF